MSYQRKQDRSIAPADTNVEAGTTQPSETVDLGGELASVVLSYAVSGSGSPSVTAEVKYDGNNNWVTEGSAKTDADGYFEFERPVEQVRLMFEETGGTNALTIDAANILAHYQPK